MYYNILNYDVLYYTKLYYTILYYTMLWCTIIYYNILNYDVLYYTTQYYTILYNTILYYIMLCCTILQYTMILYRRKLYYTPLYSTLLYSTVSYLLFYSHAQEVEGMNWKYQKQPRRQPPHYLNYLNQLQRHPLLRFLSLLLLSRTMRIIQNRLGCCVGHVTCRWGNILTWLCCVVLCFVVLCYLVLIFRLFDIVPWWILI